MKLPKLNQRVVVKPTPEDGPVDIDLQIHFDPKSMSPERQRLIYEGIGVILTGLLTRPEQRRFLKLFEAEREELKAKRRTPRHA